MAACSLSFCGLAPWSSAADRGPSVGRFGGRRDSLWSLVGTSLKTNDSWPPMR